LDIIMKKLLAVSGVLAILLLVGVVAARLRSTSERGVGEEHFQRLQTSMTRAAVERLLGGPPRNSLTQSATIWVPRAAGRLTSAEISPASPAVEFLVREDRPKNARQPALPSDLDFFPQEAAKDGHQAVWVTKTGLIAVYFGQDGKLRHKYTSKVYEPVPPSVINWLASTPGTIRRSLGF
jgi:hypothetical protein